MPCTFAIPIVAPPPGTADTVWCCGWANIFFRWLLYKKILWWLHKLLRYSYEDCNLTLAKEKGLKVKVSHLCTLPLCLFWSCSISCGHWGTLQVHKRVLWNGLHADLMLQSHNTVTSQFYFIYVGDGERSLRPLSPVLKDLPQCHGRFLKELCQCGGMWTLFHAVETL